MAAIPSLSTIAPLSAAAAIMTIGGMYLFTPRQATQSFGLPLPEKGPKVDWWLRLKGVRDIVSGLVVLAVWNWGSGPRLTGIVLAVESLTAFGDMSVVLAGGGSARMALSVHGLTGAVMIAAAIPLIRGVA